MYDLGSRIKAASQLSRKLNGILISQAQSANITLRLRQIYSENEIDEMSEKQFIRQVERVWPIAKYIDRDDGN